VRKAIRSLPKKQRIAITLRTFKNLPYEEIALIMKLSVSSVESSLFRAKKNLKKKLMKYYFSEY
jgi:RNA polymerase sigma-70 factor (ECF subfamily)